MRKLIFLNIVALIAVLTGTSRAAENQPPLSREQLDKFAVATFAGGCFWCVEADFEKVRGVHEVISGFSGGFVANPTYEQVGQGGTGHVESVQVYYDPAVIDYDGLLNAFWRMIDPTDAGGQFVDRGYQYHSVIFYANAEQRAKAELSRQRLAESKRYPAPIVTEIKAFEAFYPAEDYHQNYYRVNPLRYKFYRYRSGRDSYLEKIWGKDLHPSVTNQ